MKRLALIACCLLVCLMATSAMAANQVSVQSRTFTSGQTACTVGVFIENDVPITGIVIPLEIRTQSGDAFYLGNILNTVWNYTATGRLKNSPLGDVDDPGGLWPSGNVTRRQYSDPVNPNSCSGPTSSSYAAQAARGDTISPDGFFIASVSTGDPGIGEEISLPAGSDGATPSLRILMNLTAGTNGCMIVDTACITPANHLVYVDENSSPVVPSFVRGEITVGSGSCAQVVNQPPTAICQNVQVAADGNCQGTATPAMFDNGSSDPEDGLSVNFSMFPSPPFPLGQTQVNLVVTDSQGKADTCQATLTVVDQTPPSITCPGPLNFQCNSEVPPAYADATAFINAGGTVSDNCPGTTVAFLNADNSGGSCPLVITRRYVATDAAGNKDTCEQVITIDDTQNPVISQCNPDTTVNVPNGTPNAVVSFANLTSASDNCDPSLTYAFSPASGSTFNPGTTPVQVIVTDDCGNADTCFFNVTVNVLPPENTPPDAVCQNVQVGTNASCQGTVTAAQVNNGSSDAETPSGSLVLALNPPGPYPLGQTQVWLVVTDQGGLKDSCQATVTVVDDDNPSITCPPQITLACDNLPAPYADLDAFISAGGSASDNCDASLTFTYLGQQCQTGQICNGVCTRTYRVTDDAGNFAECQQEIRINDSIPPVLDPCPSNINATVSFGTTDTVITFSLPSATDNCGSTSVVADPPSGSSFPVGQTIVTVIATDNCGNADTCTFTVTVTEQVENALPNAICTDVKVAVTDPSNCWADADINNGSYDPDGGSVTTSQNPAGPYPLGTTLVLLTVTDDEGDTDTCSAWVTVNDTTPPSLTCPNDIKVANDPGQCGATVNYDPASATDVCDEDIDITYSHASGSFFPVGTTQVEVIGTDEDGNADTCYFNVEVIDTEKPTLSCEPFVVSNDPGVCGAYICAEDLVPYTSFSDNCPGIQGWTGIIYLPTKSEKISLEEAGCLNVPVGTWDVSYVVHDAYFNTSDTCKSTITVNDTEGPSITCPNDVKVFAPFGQSSTVVNYADPTVSDNCPGLVTRCHPPSGSVFPLGQTVVTCTTFDASNQYAVCSFTITVNEGSNQLPGPHTEVDTLRFKLGCGCDTQSVPLYCVFDPGKGDNCFFNAQTSVPGISFNAPNPGSAPTNLQVIACRGQLGVDTYAGWVYLYNAPGARSDSFWVELEVNPDQPGIDVKQDTLRFTYTGNLLEDKLCLPIDINPLGCGETCWRLVNSTGDWVWVDPTSGPAPGTAEVCVTPCAFEAGTYYYTLHFCECFDKGEEGPGEVEQPCDSLVVKLTVVDPPVLVVEPTKLQFEIDCEKKALPIPVEVSNGGGGVLDWNAWTDAGWLWIDPESGRALDTFYVGLRPDSIPCPEVCDTLLDSICVYGNKGCALNSPQWVLVELIICPPDTVECDSLCGWVYDCDCYEKSQCGLDGAIVELWDSYPDGSILSVDTADWGAFCFDVEPGVEYDIRIWKKGYCTDVFEDWSCEDGSPTFCLDPLDFILPETPLFHDYWSTNATSEGYPILPGDVIYACDSNGIIVGLAYVDAPGTFLIHVLGNVPKDVDTVDEGADPGEKVSLWLNCKCPLVVPEGFQNFGNTQFDAAWDCRPTGICCELCPGWNMFSYNIYLPDYTRENVLATIDLNYDAVRSGYCDTPTSPHLESWFANRPVNDLTHVNPFHGYDIHMTAWDTLCIEGAIIPAETPIYLCEGWNYVPYYPMEPTSMVHALQSLDGNYTNVFNLWCDNFDSYNATRPVNDLYCLYPCRGYWIKVLREDTLIYPTDGYECQEPIAKRLPSYSSGMIKGSPVAADFWGNAGMGLNAGDIIEVYSESGMLIGEAQAGEGGAFLIHAFGDVPSTSEIEGAQPGEELSFRVNGLAANVSGNIRFNDRDNSEITLTISGADPIPADYALLQNYPNPFNAGTVIPFTMKDASQWTLTIYNIMGQTVETFEGFDAAGTVRVNWNGLDRSGSTVPSGVYFYRVSTDTWTATKKMTLLK